MFVDGIISILFIPLNCTYYCVRLSLDTWLISFPLFKLSPTHQLTVSPRGYVMYLFLKYWFLKISLFSPVSPFLTQYSRGLIIYKVTAVSVPLWDWAVTPWRSDGPKATALGGDSALGTAARHSPAALGPPSGQAPGRWLPCPPRPSRVPCSCAINV